MKDYDKNKELSHLKYWDVNDLNDWEMSQSFQQIIFSGLKIILLLMKISYKAIMKKSDE